MQVSTILSSVRLRPRRGLHYLRPCAEIKHASKNRPNSIDRWCYWSSSYRDRRLYKYTQDERLRRRARMSLLVDTAGIGELLSEATLGWRVHSLPLLRMVFWSASSHVRHDSSMCSCSRWHHNLIWRCRESRLRMRMCRSHSVRSVVTHRLLHIIRGCTAYRRRTW